MNRYKISYFPPIEKNTVIKRKVIKSFNDEEQEEFLNKGFDVIKPLKSKGEYYHLKSDKNEVVELLDHQEKVLRIFF